jgi:hypothetical protein
LARDALAKSELGASDTPEVGTSSEYVTRGTTGVRSSRWILK